MAEPDQPKKETVRIELPLPPATRPAEPAVKPTDTVRIQLPVRETGSPPPRSSSQPADDISSTNFFRPPKAPAGSTPMSASVRPPSVSAAWGLKEETVRILPESVRSSQKKTQPVITVSQVAPQNQPIALAGSEKSSMLLYWMLLGLAALILIIQIWIYFS
jgi:hypothetical protein